MDSLPPETVFQIVREAVLATYQGSDGTRATRKTCCCLALVHPIWRPFAQHLLFAYVESGRGTPVNLLLYLDIVEVEPKLGNWTASLSLQSVKWSIDAGRLWGLPNLVQLRVSFADTESAANFELAKLSSLLRVCLTGRGEASFGPRGSGFGLSRQPLLEELVLAGFGRERSNPRAGLGRLSLEDRPTLRLKSLTLRDTPLALPFTVAQGLTKLIFRSTFPAPSSLSSFIAPHAPTLRLLSLSIPPIHVPDDPQPTSSPLLSNLLQPSLPFPALISLTLRSGAISLQRLLASSASFPALSALQLLDSKPVLCDRLLFTKADLWALVTKPNHLPHLRTVGFGDLAGFVLMGDDFRAVCAERGVGHRLDREERREMEWEGPEAFF